MARVTKETIVRKDEHGRVISVQHVTRTVRRAPKPTVDHNKWKITAERRGRPGTY